MAPHSSWAYRTPNLKALSYRFAVCSDDAALGRRIEALFSSLSDDSEDPDSSDVAAAEAPHRYELTATGGGEASAGLVDVVRDGELVHTSLVAGDAIGWLVWDVNRAAAETSGEHLLFHAGALQAGDAGVLVPGASGSGKSTLTAGLARAGLGYLSDELVALEVATGRLLPYPKPVTLKPGSFAALPDLAQETGGAARPDGAPREWHVPVGAGRALRIGEPCEPAFVVVPRYDAMAATTLVPLSETEAFFALALNAVNLLPHGAAGTEALGRLAARCACVALTMSDLDEACALVLDLVGAPVGAMDATERGGAGHGR